MKALRSWRITLGILAVVSAAFPRAAGATPFTFSTGDADGRLASASRQDSSGHFEIESADDFILGQDTVLAHATFTGLIPIGSTIADVGVEFYRVFPLDSTNPPSGNVPTRVNSPSDVAFATRDSADVNLSFTTSILNASFTVANTVGAGGVHPLPNQTTAGNGSATGQEILFDVTFTAPVDLPADHYFFVPQVTLNDSNDFLWLSAPKPIVAPGTPFAPDLQSWTRDANLDPDWLRIGTDIIGPPPQGGSAPTFNSAFSLDGDTVEAVPEPATLLLVGAGMALLGRFRRPPRTTK